jgi:hypothetical protein
MLHARDLALLPPMVVLGGEGRADGEVVLLAASLELPPSKRVLVVLTAAEARWLYKNGRLTGWTPGPEEE